MVQVRGLASAGVASLAELAAALCLACGGATALLAELESWAAALARASLESWAAVLARASWESA